MKNKYKIFLILILTIIFFQTKTVNAVVQVTPGGASAPESGGCPECAWVYSSNGIGVRLSLYKYDGTTLSFVSSIDLVNQPSDYPSYVNTTKYNYGRYNYTKLNATIDFGYYKLNLKDINDYGFKTIDDETVWSTTFAKEVQNYFGETSKSTRDGIKKMFNKDVSDAELSKYYIVAEPTVFFYNRVGQFYTYATGYEYMSILSEIDLSKYKGSYSWNLWESQGRHTILGYLFNGMYNQTNSSKKYPGFNDGRYDYYNFLAQDSEKSLIKTTSSVLGHKNNIKNNNAYKQVNFPYGAMIFWIGENGSIGCKGVCANLSGDNLLKCAENFCSGVSSIKDSNSKANCITNTCGYSYEKLKCDGGNTINGNNTTCASTSSSSKDECQVINKDKYSYKIDCTTYTNVIYPTTLPTSIMAGSGFEYQVRLYGNKTCIVTFDEAQWKFDYAASYSDAERVDYLNAIATFNKLSLSSNVYNSSNANISIKISEKTNGKNKTTTSKLKNEEDYYMGNNDVTSTSTNKQIISYHNNQATTVTVKTYVTDSSNGTLYNLPGVCISAKDNITIKEGSTCDNGLGPYNKYFTGVYADSTTNGTETTVTHGSAGMDVKNTCNYKVADKKLSCYITVESASNQKGNVLINNEDLIFTLHAVTNNKNSKITYNLGNKIKLPGESFNNLKQKTIYKNTVKVNTDEYIYGTVTDGTNYAYCSKVVTITPNVCQFEVEENSNNTKIIKIKSVSDPTAEYYIKDSTSNKWMNLQSKKISSKTKITVWGQVRSKGNTSYCIIEFEPDEEEGKTCTKLYKPVEYAKIKDYCASSWQKDTAGYSSSDDCYVTCTNGKTCKTLYEPTETEAIKQYCKVNYQLDGYKSSRDCINDCAYIKNGLKYYYRTISINNPFPDREAHSNWFGYEDYITNDIEDNTPSTNSGGPEYEIVLDSKRIKSIKDHTKKYNSEGNDAYGDFVRMNKKDKGSYKSKFIHVDDIEEGGFSTYFTYVEGIKTGG